MTNWDDDLNGLLATAKGQGMPPSDALVARVMADAAAVQHGVARASLAGLQVAPKSQRGPGFWARLAGAFGGIGAVAGMSAATVAGVFLGVAQPAPVAALTQALLTSAPLEQVDLLPGTDALWAEE